MKSAFFWHYEILMPLPGWRPLVSAWYVVRSFDLACTHSCGIASFRVRLLLRQSIQEELAAASVQLQRWRRSSSGVFQDLSILRPVPAGFMIKIFCAVDFSSSMSWALETWSLHLKGSEQRHNTHCIFILLFSYHFEYWKLGASVFDFNHVFSNKLGWAKVFMEKWSFFMEDNTLLY